MPPSLLLGKDVGVIVGGLEISLLFFLGRIIPIISVIVDRLVRLPSRH